MSKPTPIKKQVWFAKRHYDLLSLAMHGCKPNTDCDHSFHLQWTMDVNAIALNLQKDNPNFQLIRWIENCKAGITQPEMPVV